MTSRRQLLAAFGAILASWPLKAVAQSTQRVPVVGILTLEIEDRIPYLREGLSKLGYVEGRNIRLETRSAGDRYEQLADIVNEFVRLKVDLIVTMGATATLTASRATSTIPIVMIAGIDPVKEKFAASLSRPNGNVTGITTLHTDLSAKRLEMAKEAVPGLSRVGVLWNPDSRSSIVSLADTQQAAKALNLQLQIVEARSADGFDRAFDALVKTRTSVVIVITSSMFAANLKQLLDSAAKRRLASILATSEAVDAGALLTYGARTPGIFRHAATYVDKILKGTKPGDIPIEQPTQFELQVNMRTAKALGIKIPNSILVRADKVIE